MGGLGTGMHGVSAAAKKEAGPDEFLRNSSDSASYFYVLFHSDTWMGLGGTRTNPLFKLAHAKKILNSFV